MKRCRFSALAAGLILSGSLCLSGCSVGLKDAYSLKERVPSIEASFAAEDEAAKGFASDLCVISDEGSFDPEDVTSQAGALFDLTDREVLYSKDAFEKMYPASITKVMTSLIAIKYGNLEDQVTVTEDAVISESGATLCGIKPGDTLTLEQLLYGLMLPSGNDAGAAIAIHMAGSIDAFADMMNEEAKRLGATDTHFMNPHGLHDEDHYTTAYDLYLIFNEALKYPEFRTVTGSTAYTANYTNGAGQSVSKTWRGGNWYLTGEQETPDGLTVFSGKTGTTNSSKDTWFCGYTRYYTTAIWVGYDIPRNMPGIYGATYAGRIWKSVMDQIHEGLEPWDWIQPETVERKVDSKTGMEDYFSTTAQFRAEQSLHEKEQEQLETTLQASVDAFIEKEIGSVEDTYTVKDEYNSITSKLPLLDDGELRASLLEKVESRYDYFKEIIAGMSDEISRYEAVQAEEKKQAQEQAAKDAEAKRAQEEKAVKKQTFMQALERIENLEYQETDAEDLVSDAIDKLSLVAGDDEEASLSARLQAAISRITTLPTESEWNAAQAEKEAGEAQKESQAQVQVQSQQRQLRSALSKEQYKWNNAEIYGPGGRGDEN